MERSLSMHHSWSSISVVVDAGGSVEFGVEVAGVGPVDLAGVAVAVVGVGPVGGVGVVGDEEEDLGAVVVGEVLFSGGAGDDGVGDGGGGDDGGGGGGGADGPARSFRRLLLRSCIGEIIANFSPDPSIFAFLFFRRNSRAGRISAGRGRVAPVGAKSRRSGFSTPTGKFHPRAGFGAKVWRGWIVPVGIQSPTGGESRRSGFSTPTGTIHPR